MPRSLVRVSVTIGVFALQGDVREHLHSLERLGVSTLRVRLPEDLARCDALILPGGESSTMDKLARTFGLFEPLRKRVREGMPAFGTCAGMIMLADRIVGAIDGQQTLGGLDITVRRNAFGRQVDSFEGDLDILGLQDPFHAVFIRAPWVEATGSEVEVLARIPSGEAAGRIVAVRHGVLLATAFHPEVGGDDRLHRMFVDLVLSS